MNKYHTLRCYKNKSNNKNKKSKHKYKFQCTYQNKYKRKINQYLLLRNHKIFDCVRKFMNLIVRK